MARKCENCIHDKVCNMWALDSGIPFVNADTCEHYKPTADAVPKSELHDDHHKQVACYTLGCREGDKIRREVAREIFEEIEEEINAALKNNYARRSECNAETDLSHAANISGKIACLRGLADFVEELKKKYTEGKDEQAPTRDPI